MPSEVLLHVYSLAEGGAGKFFSKIGLGVWHSGVELYGKEYCFSPGMTGDSSVFLHPQDVLVELPESCRSLSIRRGVAIAAAHELNNGHACYLPNTKRILLRGQGEYAFRSQSSHRQMLSIRKQ
jgi:hypothetical protein